MKYFKPKSNKILILNICEVCAYFLLICGLIYYVNGVIQKYLFDPHIGITEIQRQVHEIPFPAVTICSPVVLRSGMANMKEFVRYYHHHGAIKNLSINEKNFLSAKAHSCTINMPNIFNEGTKNKTEFNVVKLLVQGSLSVNESFITCGRNNRVINCEMSRSLTDHGLCYTFNSQGYNTIFNKGVISSDFDVFKSEEKVG